MDTNDQYFDCLCRTCMNELVEASSYDGNTKPQQQWQSIFDRIEECGAFRIAELLTNAVPQIEVQPRDELPKRICSKCLEELLIVYRFQQMCIQSEQQMRQQVPEKRSDFEIPMIGAAMEGEIETNKAGMNPLTSLQPSTTHQNLEHSSMQESLLETTEQMIKPEAAETSDDDINKLLEDCRDADGNLSEFVKNESIEDDEPSIEYSDGESTTSAISEKGERLSIEFEEEQINETNVKAKRIIHGEDKRYECPYCPQRFNLKSSYYRHKESHEDVECEICSKSIRKGRLKEHKRIHSDKKAHKCVLCEKSFDKISHLRYHSRKHTGEKPYKCKYCERSFSCSSNRLKHMRDHIGANVHRCELCALAFPAASELRAHLTTHKNEDSETRKRNMKALKEAEAELEIQAKENVKANRIIHGEGKRYECPYCPRRFNLKSSYYRHKANHKDVDKRIHSDKKAHKCDLCEKSFHKISHLRYHSRKHTGEKPYKCKYCERSFSSSSNRLKHMRDHIGDNVHRCELCPLAFPAASELRAHLTTHKNEDSETRKRNMKALKEAEAELEIKAKEKKEHKRIHCDEKAHKCDLCAKSFDKISDLRVHIRKHTGEQPYKCKYCQRSFSQSSTRLTHMRLHLGNNVHRCELCPLAFPAASELRAHFTTHKKEDSDTRKRNMKALKEAEAELEIQAKENVTANPIIHGEDKPYECSYCPRRFNVKSSYYHHKESHEDVVCKICGKSIRKGRLKEHERIHSDKKAHKCDLCEKSFYKISHLRYHSRKHTGEKPYKCKYCERSFSSSSNRLKHMRVHIGDNIHRCELCPLAFPAASELRAHLTTHKNEDSETRKRNMKALKEAEAELEIQAKE